MLTIISNPLSTQMNELTATEHRPCTMFLQRRVLTATSVNTVNQFSAQAPWPLPSPAWQCEPWTSGPLCHRPSDDAAAQSTTHQLSDTAELILKLNFV